MKIKQDKYDRLDKKVKGFKLENGALRNIKRTFTEAKFLTNTMIIHPRKHSMVKYKYTFDRIENDFAIYRMESNV